MFNGESDDKSAEGTRVSETGHTLTRPTLLGVTLLPAHPNARFASVAGFNETQPASLTVQCTLTPARSLWGCVASTGPGRAEPVSAYPVQCMTSERRLGYPTDDSLARLSMLTIVS